MIICQDLLCNKTAYLHRSVTITAFLHIYVLLSLSTRLSDFQANYPSSFTLQFNWTQVYLSIWSYKCCSVCFIQLPSETRNFFVEHLVQCLCPLHAPLCVLSTMLLVNCTLFDNILLAGSATDTLCQSVQGTLAVSAALLMLRVINGMLICSELILSIYVGT